VYEGNISAKVIILLSNIFSWLALVSL